MLAVYSKNRKIFHYDPKRRNKLYVCGFNLCFYSIYCSMTLRLLSTILYHMKCCIQEDKVKHDKNY